jgi:multiple sugar transport system permease protein
MATLVSSNTEAQTRSATRQRVQRPNLALSPILAMVFLSVATVYFLLPLYWLIISSTKDTVDLFNSFGLWFGDRNSLWVNLSGLFTTENGIYIHWLVNSAIYAGTSAVLATLISLMSGYALAKFDFPGRNFSFSVILGALLVPTTALVLPLYLLMSQFNLTNTYWSVLLPSIVSPFGVYLARIYITSSVPTELIEAARVDGLGEVRTFFSIVLPLVRPAMITVFLFQFVAVWNNFFLPLVMLNDSTLYPLTLGLQTWYSRAGGASSNNLLYSLVVIGSLVAVIPLIAGFLTLQRFWRGGLAAGGVKG